MVSKPGSGQQDLLEKGDEGFENSRGLSGGVQLGEGEGWSGGVDRSTTSEIDAISCSAVCLWEEWALWGEWGEDKGEPYMGQ